jgi:acyl-CoA thioester hydrolase
VGFANRIRVRYAEIDGQGVVFNAHWLTYFDDSCTRFVESLGFGAEFWTKEFDVMLVKAVVEWQGPAHFDEWVDIDVVPARLGTKSFDLRYRAHVGDRVCCAATITYCGVEPGSNLPVAIPDRMRVALAERMEESTS